MAKHLNTGKKGEELANAYLLNKGYDIIEINWRYSHWELDIIAIKNNVLHFVEVKTRRSFSFGFPEDKVTNKKIHYLRSAAEQYLYLHPQWKRIQFDVLSITIFPDESIDYFLIEDVST